MDTSRISVRTVSGEEVKAFVPDLARLRIEVFREFPYLYEGSLDYESEYLLSYANSARSVFVLAFDGGEVVGVSTGVPLLDGETDFRSLFTEADYEAERIFYFGESVLRAAYRGTGIGARFMKEREAFARERGEFSHCAFCAVQRAEDHAARPAGYRPLHGFWRKYGFVERPDLEVSFSWKEIGEEERSPKTMRFWVKAL